MTYKFYLNKSKFKDIIKNKKLSNKEDIKKEFKEWISAENISVEEKNNIIKTLHILEDNIVLFRNLEGELNTIKLNIKKSDVTELELYVFAKVKAMELWNRDFNIDIELVNRKWKRTNGVYVKYSDGKRIIRMSKKTNWNRSREDVLKTLLHEMVHWHLETIGKPYKDTDIDFINEIIRVGASFSKTKKSLRALKLMGLLDK